MRVYIEEMVAEAERELVMRRRVYGRRWEAGTMSKADAAWKMAIQEEIIGVLKVLAALVDSVCVAEAEAGGFGIGIDKVG